MSKVAACRRFGPTRSSCRPGARNVGANASPNPDLGATSEAFHWTRWAYRGCDIAAAHGQTLLTLPISTAPGTGSIIVIVTSDARVKPTWIVIDWVSGAPCESGSVGIDVTVTT